MSSTGINRRRTGGCPTGAANSGRIRSRRSAGGAKPRLSAAHSACRRAARTRGTVVAGASSGGDGAFRQSSLWPQHKRRDFSHSERCPAAKWPEVPRNGRLRTSTPGRPVPPHPCGTGGRQFPVHRPEPTDRHLFRIRPRTPASAFPDRRPIRRRTARPRSFSVFSARLRSLTVFSGSRIGYPRRLTRYAKSR